MKQKFLRPEEIATALRISRAAAYRLISTGQLAGVRIGGSIRVSVDAFERWLATQPSAAHATDVRA